ncbi:MAG: glycosyltransferase family 87 protein [Pseudomonadota bacterium]
MPSPSPTCRALLFGSLIAFALLVALCAKRIDHASHGKASTDYSNVLVSDFVNDWTAAHLVHADKVAVLFDRAAYRQYMDDMWGRPVEPHDWSYPPHLLTLIAPLHALPYFPAWALWSALGLLAYYCAMRRAQPALPRGWQALILLGPASMVNLMHGQTGFFSAAFLLGGLYLLPKKPWMAGVLFGLLTLKPHLGLLLVPLLLMLWQWRAILAACATAGTLIGLSLLQWGVAPWVAYFTTTRMNHLDFLEHYEGFYTLVMPGAMAAQRMLGVPMGTAWVGYGAVALASAAAALWIVRREGLTARAILGLALATLLVTPYGFNYDMTIIALPLGVYLYAQATMRSPFAAASWWFLWIAPAAIYLLNLFSLPLVAVALIGTLGMLVWQCRTDAA